MKRINFNNKALVLIAFLSFVGLYSCDSLEIPTYESENSLFFERWRTISNSSKERIDTAYYSFSHYPMKNEIEHDFKLCLIGDLLSEDKEFKVEIVEELTTATSDMYSLPERCIFPKNVVDTNFKVKIKRTSLLKDKEVVLVCRLIANENFRLGFQSYTDIKIRFNDMNVKPLWWNKDNAVNDYLGEYTSKKYKCLLLANPDFDPSLISGTYLRKVALKTKEYAATHSEYSDVMIPIY